MTRPAIIGPNNALEIQVDRTLTARRISGGACSAIEDREFARLLDMLSSRIRHLIHAYRLTDMFDDAQQASAIAVLRALESYDPHQSRFTTHVTWQIRGELQSLRHRVRLDQRRSARSAGITTVQIEALAEAQPQVFEIVDEDACGRTEEAASDAMAQRLMEGLLDRLESPEHERAIVMEQLLERGPQPQTLDYTNEQRRQITRRTFRNCAKVVAGGGQSSA